MGQITDIGRRIELVPMDLHFHDITIALYRQERESRPVFLVHTYSRKAGAQDRIEFLRGAMEVLGGMERTPEGLLRFPCGEVHELACRRAFLEACKLASDVDLEPRPLAVQDKKAGVSMVLVGLEDGLYQVRAEGEGKHTEKRIAAITGGLMKLGEMLAVEGREDMTAFSCRQSHDALLGLLLVRAPNVRAAFREQEIAASRGMLAAPSQQR